MIRLKGTCSACGANEPVETIMAVSFHEHANLTLCEQDAKKFWKSVTTKWGGQLTAGSAEPEHGAEKPPAKKASSKKTSAKKTSPKNAAPKGAAKPQVTKEEILELDAPISSYDPAVIRAARAWGLETGRLPEGFRGRLPNDVLAAYVQGSR